MEFENKLKTVFKENDITILDFNGEKDKIVYECNQCGTVYKYSCARNLFSKITLCKKCYNPFTRWNRERIYNLKLKRLYPKSELELIDFISLRGGGKVRCLKCNETESIKNFEPLFAARKDYFCNNCEKDKEKTLQHLQEELKQGHIELLKWNGTNEKAKFQCNRCGYIFEKMVRKNFDGKICPQCYKVHNKFTFQDAEKLLQKRAGADYTLLQFTDTQHRSLIKHKCGFCFTVRIEDFEKTRGCPKCFRKYSKLEQKVAHFLDDHGFSYVRQKRFNDFKKYSYDFEVDIDGNKILLEVQGQQHYREVEIFNSFEKQKERDNIKRDYCLVNNIPLIEIPYWEINNLEEFLLLKFNDYLQKE